MRWLGRRVRRFQIGLPGFCSISLLQTDHHESVMDSAKAFLRSLCLSRDEASTSATSSSRRPSRGTDCPAEVSTIGLTC